MLLRRTDGREQPASRYCPRACRQTAVLFLQPVPGPAEITVSWTQGESVFHSSGGAKFRVQDGEAHFVFTECPHPPLPGAAGRGGGGGGGGGRRSVQHSWHTAESTQPHRITTHHIGQIPPLKGSEWSPFRHHLMFRFHGEQDGSICWLLSSTVGN